MFLNTINWPGEAGDIYQSLERSYLSLLVSQARERCSIELSIRLFPDLNTACRSSSKIMQWFSPLHLSSPSRTILDSRPPTHCRAMGGRIFYDLTPHFLHFEQKTCQRSPAAREIYCNEGSIKDVDRLQIISQRRKKISMDESWPRWGSKEKNFQAVVRTRNLNIYRLSNGYGFFSSHRHEWDDIGTQSSTRKLTHLNQTIIPHLLEIMFSPLLMPKLGPSL